MVQYTVIISLLFNRLPLRAIPLLHLGCMLVCNAAARKKLPPLPPLLDKTQKESLMDFTVNERKFRCSIARCSVDFSRDQLPD